MICLHRSSKCRIASCKQFNRPLLALWVDGIVNRVKVTRTGYRTAKISRWKLFMHWCHLVGNPRLTESRFLWKICRRTKLQAPSVQRWGRKGARFWPVFGPQNFQGWLGESDVDGSKIRHLPIIVPNLPQTPTWAVHLDPLGPPDFMCPCTLPPNHV